MVGMEVIQHRPWVMSTFSLTLPMSNPIHYCAKPNPAAPEMADGAGLKREGWSQRLLNNLYEFCYK